MTLSPFFGVAQRNHKRVSAAPTAQAVIVTGQSNGQYLHTYGRTEFKGVLDTYWPSSTNSLLDGATSGSALLKSNTADSNWWYDEVGLVYGDAWTEFAAQIATYSGTIRAIIWDQGESDQGVIASNPTKQATYKAGLLTVFNAMRTLVGNVPVLICPIGRRGDATTGTGYQVMREIQQQMDADYAWIHMLPEKFTEDDDGGAHLVMPGGYQNYAVKAARKTLSVLGELLLGVDGPKLVSATRTGNVITAAIAHDTGTDLIPTSAIQGFKFFDNTTEIVITNAARKDATHIDLTLASIPTTGTPKLYYAYDRITGVDETKLVKDNSGYAMPLRAGLITSVPRVETYMDEIVAGAVFQHDARLKGYSGAQTISNLISFPHDGETKAVYDGTLGTSSSAGTDDPGFSTDHWTFDGGDYTHVNTVSTFLGGLATNKSFTFLCHFKSPPSWPAQVNIFSCGGNSGTIPGILLRYITASNCMRIATSNGTTPVTYNMTTATQLATNTEYKMAISVNPSTGSFNVWLNSSTPVLSGTATLGGASSTTGFSVFNQFTAGTELYGYGMYDSVLNNTQIGSLFSYYDSL